MTIEVDVDHRLGEFHLRVAFRSEGALTALFGPSGSGKTSLISIIAGLIRPQRGRVVVEGAVLTDSDRRIFVPKHRRRVGYVFQEGRLFPHLSVRRNLLYGRWFTPARDRYAALGPIVELLGIGHLLERSPAALSGGEKQRVAIGRALLASPRLLLMDEPLASLDEERKAEILPYVERLRDEMKVPIVYVSHSVAEVSRLATTMVALSAGAVTDFGPAVEVLNRLDGAVGSNEIGVLIEAEVAGHDPELGLTRLRCRAGDLQIPLINAGPGSTARVRVRPEDVLIATESPSGLSAQNIFAGIVTAMGAARGSTVEVNIDCSGQLLRARITRRAVEQLALAPDKKVYAIVKSVAVDPAWLGSFPAGRAM